MSHHFMTLSSPMFLGYVEHGRWHPGISDPTPMGWITTVCYFAGALMCLYRAWTCQREPALRGKPGWFWMACGLLMLLLCINKQLDLHELITQTGRNWARADGWYQNRREVQLRFVKCLAAVTVIVVLFSIWFLWGMRIEYHVALLGLIFTFCYILVRAASFHHVDRFLGLGTEGFRLNWVFELGGIFIVGGAAWVAGAPATGIAKPEVQGG